MPPIMNSQTGMSVNAAINTVWRGVPTSSTKVFLKSCVNLTL